MPSALTIAAKNAGILPPGVDGKEIVPLILAWIGGGTGSPLAVALTLTLIVPALGCASSMLRIRTKTVLDFNFVAPSTRNRILIAFFNVCFTIVVALKGGVLVDLIVSFCAAYVAAALVPFVAYLLEDRGWFKFVPSSVVVSSFAGTISALTVLVLVLFLPDAVIFNSPELTIMITGICFGLLGLWIGTAVAPLVGLTDAPQSFPSFREKLPKINNS